MKLSGNLHAKTYALLVLMVWCSSLGNVLLSKGMKDVGEVREWALLPLQLLKVLGRRDVIAWADGPLGMWTRLLAPQFGAPFVPEAMESVATIAQFITRH